MPATATLEPAAAGALLPVSAHPRLRLRRFQAGDADDVAALHRLPRVRAQLVDDHPLDQPAVAALFVQRMAAIYEAHPGLGIWHAADDLGFVGWFSLMPMAAWPGAMELGSRLHPRVWGTGLVMDGCEAVLHHAFDGLHASAVWGACAPDNHAARLCLGALGFKALAMAPYESEARPALFHHLGRQAWQQVPGRPRGQRLRQAVRQARAPVPD